MCSLSLSIGSPVSYIAKALHKKDKRVFTIQEYKKKMPATHTNSQHKTYGHQKTTPPVVVINRISKQSGSLNLEQS